MEKEHFGGYLQLSKEEMKKIGYHIIDFIVDHLDTIHDSPVSKVESRKG
ncbi:hypothetical protein [Bacillus sp. Marseille-P3661]|nr:hypothetical protein [Bacillus sp. Marseille-P3661]